jgi:hypothetical protein
MALSFDCHLLISKLVMLLREFGTHASSPWHTNGLNLQCASGTRFVVGCRSGDDPSDRLVLAMRENAQLSASSSVIDVHVRSSLWASQLQKLLHSLHDASSFVPWGLPRCMMKKRDIVALN